MNMRNKQLITIPVSDRVIVLLQQYAKRYGMKTYEVAAVILETQVLDKTKSNT